ncbi:MAG TPA: hypothetical protein VNL73_06650 [Verrucomicrobiae bacterium]|nr:hypothetical protein [Verrucomicrobiae bacterium]
MPITTHRQAQRWERQHFAWRQRECSDSISYYVRNEWPGKEDYIQTYYLTKDGSVLAESWRNIPSGKFMGRAARGAWPFAVHRRHLNEDTIRSIFEKQVYHPIDSITLVLPLPVDDMLRPLSWHIWAGQTEWYFWVYNGWLMTTDEYKRKRETYFELFKSFNKDHPRRQVK